MPTTTSRPAARGRAARARRARRDAPAKPTTEENVWFWIKALAIILIVRAFLFEPYRIPSESMEDTLLVGDFLIVSKVHWGPRTPNTIGIPFTPISIPGLRFPQTRLPGFTEPERGDVVVFNYPAAVDVERGAIPEDTPTERRAPYIKRLVAVPGDTLAVFDKVLHINGRPVPLAPTMKQRWRVYGTGATRANARQLAEEGVVLIPNSDRREGSAVVSPREYDVYATPGAVRDLEARADVDRVEPFIWDERFSDQTFGANPDHVAPVVIPGEGVTVALTPRTIPQYAEAIERYEGRSVVLEGDRIRIDGELADRYTFQQNYYFAMGDFRDNSVDSRYWGFVPETHLVGKAVMTFLSFERYLPPIPRLSRFFRPIP